MTQHSLRFRAMGTDVHVITRGSDPVAPMRARDRIAALESAWSRFRTSSELSSVNRAAGRWVPVSPETFGVVRLALLARDRTDGLVDPTVGAAVRRAGYDRDFADVAPIAGVADDELRLPAGAEVELDRAQRAVRLAPGACLDLGGIGKGAAADAVAAELLASGSDGVLVNLGGDLRVAGTPPPGGWIITLDAPNGSALPELRLCIAEGAVATSGTYRRRWQGPDGSLRHHLIDPRTGAPAVTDVWSSTAVAAEAWWAEAAAKAALLSGMALAPERRTALGVTGCDVGTDGVRRCDVSLAAFALGTGVAA